MHGFNYFIRYYQNIYYQSNYLLKIIVSNKDIRGLLNKKLLNNL